MTQTESRTGLRGSHVVVVGATGVLGGGIARALAARGASLTISGRRAVPLGQLRDELGPAVVEVVETDLTLPTAAATVVEAATAGGRQVDGLVFAAGVVAFGPATEIDDDVLDELLLTNLVAPIRLVREVVPHLGQGSFVANLSAVVAESPTAGMAAYSAAKAGLTAFDVAAGTELRRRGVRVIDVRPPHTETGLATRPVAGSAPRLPTGLDPAQVVARVVAAIEGTDREVASRSFS